MFEISVPIAERECALQGQSVHSYNSLPKHSCIILLGGDCFESKHKIHFWVADFSSAVLKLELHKSCNCCLHVCPFDNAFTFCILQ
jgi:hypothetical protein